jgi:hypothetical protein
VLINLVLQIEGVIIIFNLPQSSNPLIICPYLLQSYGFHVCAFLSVASYTILGHAIGFLYKNEQHNFCCTLETIYNGVISTIPITEHIVLERTAKFSTQINCLKEFHLGPDTSEARGGADMTTILGALKHGGFVTTKL